MPADRALLWPILIPVAAALILGTTYSFGTLLVFPALLGAVLTAMGWLLWVVVSGITAFWRRKWRRAASLIVALVLFAPAVWLCARSGDYVHLAIMLPYYETKIYHSGPDDQTSFHWQPAGLIPNYENAVVYDPSDRLAEKVGHPEARPDDMETITVRHLIGHWYVSTQTW